MKDRVFELTDIVRETGYAIHCYHGPGHLEPIRISQHNGT